MRLFVYASVKREVIPPETRPVAKHACFPSLNELSRSCKKGSSFLASISIKMNRYARFAIDSIFSLSFPIKALKYNFR